MDENSDDIRLLKENPKGLIVKYQSLINYIVCNYINNGFFNRYDKDDIVQNINESLLKKITKIQIQYNYKTKVKTYISVIIRNNCREIIRKVKLEIVHHKNIENLVFVVNEPENKLIIKQEFDKLDKIFTMFYRQRYNR